MLDCGRVNALRLRFPNREPADLLLSRGVHAIGRDAQGRLRRVTDASEAMVQFCADRRGVWLQLRDGVRTGYVNGRPVRKMAMLRAGDVVFVDGVELSLLGEPPLPLPGPDAVATGEDPRVVLRGIGGAHHGRSFSLDQPRLIGRGPGCDIRLNEALIAEQHARLEPHPLGALIRGLVVGDSIEINGHPAHEGLLRPGDQIVFEGNQRFVVESPRSAAAIDAEIAIADALPEADAVMTQGDGTPESAWRVPWLLLAAAFLAALLSLLLLYGVG